jgi:hypothetical protein
MLEPKGGDERRSFNRQLGDGILLIEAIILRTNRAPAKAVQHGSANIANTLAFFTHIPTTPFPNFTEFDPLAISTYLASWKSRNSKDSANWLHIDGDAGALGQSAVELIGGARRIARIRLLLMLMPDAGTLPRPTSCQNPLRFSLIPFERPFRNGPQTL